MILFVLFLAGVPTIALAAGPPNAEPSFSGALAAISDWLKTAGLIGMVVGGLMWIVGRTYIKKVVNVKGLGKVVPAQLGLMKLAGLAANFMERIENPTDEEIARHKLEGYKYLRRMTRQDFGTDVEKWFGYLTANAEKFRFTFPEGYAIMRSFLGECGYNLPWNEALATID
jgi:hypothetical protein